MDNTLDKLRELTNNLPPVPKLGEFKVEHPAFTEYVMDVGSCISYNLLNQKEVSVAKTFISSGGQFPEHDHDEAEYAVVFSGAMIAYYGDKKKTMMAGDCIKFEKGEKHRVRALEDTWIIAVTVPRSKDFPNA